MARIEVGTRLDRAVRSAGLSYAGLDIRGQRTRWASCSPSGHMSFNWRLLLAPEEILEYVIWHEVCHLEILDHSRAFWRLLGSWRPSWRAEREWLRRNGATLTL
jgi:predicted metal-dependent hydrolase